LRHTGWQRQLAGQKFSGYGRIFVPDFCSPSSFFCIILGPAQVGSQLKYPHDVFLALENALFLRVASHRSIEAAL
jgi:hypothetical protein